MMQRFKGLIKLKQARNGLLSYQRNFSALPYDAQYDDPQDQVLVEGRAKSRAAILNRPASRNALTIPMVARLKRLYESWEENHDIGFVLMKGSGKAFCSGSDVVSLCELLNEGKMEECKTYFQTLYKFVYLQATYLKPNVAILDGFTMGSGAGIAVPGMFRVATNKTVFAHPEAQIGFHPDAGASFYLSRLPGYLGEYLALTGDKLNGVEMIACGLASHYALHERLDLVEERLGKLITDEATVIETSLAQYGDLVYPDKTSILYKFETFDERFSHDTVEEIVDALENEKASTYDEWCERAISKKKEVAPLSLKVTLQLCMERICFEVRHIFRKNLHGGWWPSLVIMSLIGWLSRDFLPAPKVDSSVVIIQPKDQIPGVNLDEWCEFTKTCFEKKNRTLGAAFKQKVIELFRLPKMASSNREEMNRN